MKCNGLVAGLALLHLGGIAACSDGSTTAGSDSITYDIGDAGAASVADGHVADELGVPDGAELLDRCIYDWGLPFDSKIDPDPLIDGQRFREVLRDNLDLFGRVKGYSVVLQSPRGRNVVRDAAGWAVDNCSPGGPIAFTHDTRTAWGSVGKVITTVASLHAMDHTPGFDLQTRLVDSMPRRWEPHDKFASVTWADILSHKAGLRKSAGTGSHGSSALRVRFESSFRDDPSVGRRRYSNTLGAAGKFLLPHIAPERNELLEASWWPIDYDGLHDRLASEAYIDYAKRHVLDPAGATTATCNMGEVVDAGLPYARVYEDAFDRDGELLGDKTYNCPSGGWVLSSREMARVLRTLAQTDVILGPRTYARMVQPADDSDVLGFNPPDDEFMGGVAIPKGGDISGYSAYVAILPRGYVVVAATNSARLGSGGLRRAVKRAWNAAYREPAQWTQ